IRGPVIERAGPGVKVLAEYAGKPALVQRENIMAATFHPELTDDTTVHEYFLRLAGTRAKQHANGAKSSSREKRKLRHRRRPARSAREYCLCASAMHAEVQWRKESRATM